MYPIILVTASEPRQAEDDSDSSGGEREPADTAGIIGAIEVEETLDEEEEGSDQEEADGGEGPENDEVNGLAIGRRPLQQSSKPRAGSVGNSSSAAVLGTVGSFGSFGSFGSMGSIRIEYDNEEEDETTSASRDGQNATRGEQFSVTGVVRGDEVGSLDGPRRYAAAAASGSPFQSSHSGGGSGGGSSAPSKLEPLAGPAGTTASRCGANEGDTVAQEEEEEEESPR